MVDAAADSNAPRAFRAPAWIVLSIVALLPPLETQVAHLLAADLLWIGFLIFCVRQQDVPDESSVTVDVAKAVT